MNKTIIKSMDILNLFTKYPKLSLNEMVELSGKPKTSIHRVVKTFEEIGFFEQDEEGSYQLGLLFLKYGQLVLERLDLHKVAYPFMKSLYEQTGENIILTIRDGDESINIASIESDQPVKIRSKIGERTPLYAGAPSRIILAFLDDVEIKEYIARTSLRKLADDTITDQNELLRSLDDAREKGYCYSLSEIQNLGVGIAAPIFNHNGKIIAGLSIAGLHTHFTDEKTPMVIEKVKETAKELSVKLGYEIS
ncbi:IclR family transcriptional regulator [Robertmurraya massiliosenegalensis]|uniref:IclR family transcriptional regulator n=1 Tax=Robertmurraya massiliosenegalensis TaxID=1287657 RepID=UPI0002F1F6BD|nr:IclR family transcriptional regulator [Robertmurraya massiliosenegalensis]